MTNIKNYKRTNIKKMLENVKFVDESKNNEEVIESIFNNYGGKTDVVLDSVDLEKALKDSFVVDTKTTKITTNDDIENMIKDIESVGEVKNISIKFNTHPDTSLGDIAEVMEAIYEKFDNTEILFGSQCDSSLDKDCMNIQMGVFYKNADIS